MLSSSATTRVTSWICRKRQGAGFGRVKFHAEDPPSPLSRTPLSGPRHRSLRPVVPTILPHLAGPRGTDGRTRLESGPFDDWALGSTVCARTTQAYSPGRSAAEPVWRVDETYIRVAGVWTYLYRAVDSTGETIDFMLSPKRVVVAAKHFLQMALWRAGHIRPRVINVDGHASYPPAIEELKESGELGRRC